MNAVAVPGAVWSAQQRQWLAALGHVVYVHGTGAIAADIEVPGVEASAAATHADHAEMRAPAPGNRGTRDARPVAPAVSMPPDLAVEPVSREAGRTPVPVRAPSRLPDKLHFALIRASGCNPNAPGADALFAQWPSSSELRGNPEAKRALWPVLRALRRNGAAPG